MQKYGKLLFPAASGIKDRKETNFLEKRNKQMSDKTILEQWRAIAYDQQADRNKLQQFWANYFNIEKGIYEELLANPDEVVKGTVKELAEKYGQEVLTMVGFLDGINDSLKLPNPIETMDENTVVNLGFDKDHVSSSSSCDLKNPPLYLHPMICFCCIFLP